MGSGLQLLSAREAMAGQPADPAEYHAVIARLARRLRVVLPAWSDELLDELAAPAVAYVNEGRWVADCPEVGCGGAMLLLPDAGFLCGNCFNGGIAHRYRPVTWPAELEEIELALVERPVPQTRNWTSTPRPAWGVLAGESVADLQIENAVMLGAP